MARQKGVGPYDSSDPDTGRIWWTDVGVHQNLTFPVHPDPVSGMHCWHQAVRVRKAGPGDRVGDIFGGHWIDRARCTDRWLAPDAAGRPRQPRRSRRPYWLMRPLKPARDVYRLPDPAVSR